MLTPTAPDVVGPNRHLEGEAKFLLTRLQAYNRTTSEALCGAATVLIACVGNAGELRTANLGLFWVYQVLCVAAQLVSQSEAISLTPTKY